MFRGASKFAWLNVFPLRSATILPSISDFTVGIQGDTKNGEHVQSGIKNGETNFDVPVVVEIGDSYNFHRQPVVRLRDTFEDAVLGLDFRS